MRAEPLPWRGSLFGLHHCALPCACPQKRRRGGQPLAGSRPAHGLCATPQACAPPCVTKRRSCQQRHFAFCPACVAGRVLARFALPCFVVSGRMLSSSCSSGVCCFTCVVWSCARKNVLSAMPIPRLLCLPVSARGCVHLSAPCAAGPAQRQHTAHKKAAGFSNQRPWGAISGSMIERQVFTGCALPARRSWARFCWAAWSRVAGREPHRGFLWAEQAGRPHRAE